MEMAMFISLTYTAQYGNDDCEREYPYDDRYYHHPVGDALSRDLGDGRRHSESDLYECIHG